MEQEIQTQSAIHPNKYEGIKGWLIFVIVFLAANPIGSLYHVTTNLIPFFQEGNWDDITTKGTKLYHPIFGTVIVLELAMYIFITVMTVFLLYQMLRRRAIFPKLFISFLLADLIIGFLYAGGYMIVTTFVPAFQDVREDLYFEIGTSVGSHILFALIWIPYFLKSKRVKATFTTDAYEDS
ncbi:uncharacterized protein DUF2569 [Bacillus oleivorans]|uniref:Uncharacterized protein DUF2569 n=1 Tax=Bacillus oleivorans TaxID=1448271 RepID=A0A285D420_9BACI|nr:DUF2569 domain-containing protein [Bacillus oleivorans]SNX74529.1 uncharacterized protein DUF2569 [Bacillus oleivorans]